MGCWIQAHIYTDKPFLITAINIYSGVKEWWTQSLKVKGPMVLYDQNSTREMSVMLVLTLYDLIFYQICFALLWYYRFQMFLKRHCLCKLLREAGPGWEVSGYACYTCFKQQWRISQLVCSITTQDRNNVLFPLCIIGRTFTE